MAKSSKKRINLALQGGGAHGAFTWGVLDRLLREDELEISGISGTSAGALNGAALKAGMAHGGRDQAIENLDWLWAQMGAREGSTAYDWWAQFLPSPSAVSKAIEYSPGYAIADGIGRMVSPYAFGPFASNPLETIVNRFDYPAVCSSKGPDLFICATNVRTGKVRVFEQKELRPEVIMASACLPTLFKAVEVAEPDGTVHAYWDGGYTGNPALFPLFEDRFPDDIVVININPLERADVPFTPQEIQNRINEISFNSSLFREMRAISFVKRLIRDGRVERGKMKDVNIHMIADDALMNELSVATKLVPTPYILAKLKEAGQRAADTWLDQHKDQINVECSVDLIAMFD